MTLAVFALALAAAAAGVWLHHLFEGEWLPSDLWREWKLWRTPLSALDAAWTGDGRRSDIVVSLTTIPSRIEAIDETLKSLLDQSRRPRRVILNVPQFSRREQVAYVVPERFRALTSLEIRTCEDWGPATKLIPALLSEEPDQPILVVDDDRIYPSWMVERFEAAARRQPDAALTLAGWIVPADLTDRPTTILSNLLMLPPAPVRAPRVSAPAAVDIVQGVMGYLVRPRFFDAAEMTDFTGPEALRYVDDVRTSALCQVQRYVIPAPSLGFIPRRRWSLLAGTALGRINRGTGSDEDRHNTIAIRHYADCWRVGAKHRPPCHGPAWTRWPIVRWLARLS